ncbi:7346_t:CDS:1, partial [Funneliformis mosseae]
HGIVHFYTIKDASIFYYDMQGNYAELYNIMIKFSAAFKFETKEEFLYPKFEISTSIPVMSPANVKSS